MWKEDKVGMDDIIKTYFASLFATENPCGFEEAMSGVEKVVTLEMNNTLDMEPTGEEIREALFQMHP